LDGVVSMNSPYYKYFKKNSGKINHYFITSYVGVDLIDDKTEVPKNLSTSWKPNDVESSKLQTNIFLRKSMITFTASTSESLIEDLYSNLIPYTTYDYVISEIGNTKSVSKKIRLIQEAMTKKGVELNYDYFLFFTMIQWRNNIVHKNKSKLNSEITSTLMKYKGDIMNDRSHLDISLLINNFNKFGTPTFKETISLVAATHRILEKIDELIFEDLNQIEYLKHFFKEWFSTNPKSLKKYSYKHTKEERKRILLQIISRNIPMDLNYEANEFLNELTESDFKNFITTLDL